MVTLTTTGNYFYSLYLISERLLLTNIFLGLLSNEGKEGAGIHAIS